MYNFRYTNPRLNGYIYRRKKRCGKNGQYRYTAYYLQYRERVDGKWKRRSEYVPKNKVRALRARIKRAKQRDREAREIMQSFLSTVPRLVKNLKHNINPDETSKLIDLWTKIISDEKVMNQLSALQATKLCCSLTDIILAWQNLNDTTRK